MVTAAALASACAGPQFDALLATYHEPGACRVPHEAPLDPPGAPSSVAVTFGAEFLRLRDRSADERFTPGAPHAVAWLPDGEHLVSAGRGSLFVWHARSGEATRAIALPAEIEGVTSVAPSRDGRTIALRFVRDRKTAQTEWLALVEMATGAVDTLGRVPDAPIGADRGAPLSFSDDGQRLVVGHEVWSLAQRRRVWSGPGALASDAPEACKGLLSPAKAGLNSDPKPALTALCPALHLLPDGQRAVEVRGEGGGLVAPAGIPYWQPDRWVIEVRGLDAPGPGRRLGVSDAVGPAPYRLVFSENRRFVAELGPTVRIWSTETGKLVATLPGGEGDRKVSGVQISNDGEVAAVWQRPVQVDFVGGPLRAPSMIRLERPPPAPPGPALVIWSLTTHRPLWQRPVLDSFSHAAFSPDGRLLLTTNLFKRGVLAIESRTGEVKAALPEHAGPVSPSSAYAVSPIEADQGFDVHSLETGRPLVEVARRGAFRAASADGAAVFREALEQVALRREGRCVALAPPGADDRAFSPPWADDLAFSPDGRHLFGASYYHDEPVAMAWSATTGRLEASVGVGRGGRVVVLPGTGQVLAEAHERQDDYWLIDLLGDRGVRTVPASLRRYVRPNGTPGVAPVDLVGARGAVASLDGRLLVGNAGTLGLSIWNVVEGGDLRTMPQSASIEALALSPDGREAAVGGARGELFVSDLATRRSRALEGWHAGAITALAFSPDGARLASAGLDRTLRLNDARSGRPLALVDLGPRHDHALSATFSPDGSLLTVYTARGARLRFDVGPPTR